jgi:hypothetical protein
MFIFSFRCIGNNDRSKNIPVTIKAQCEQEAREKIIKIYVEKPHSIILDSIKEE